MLNKLLGILPDASAHGQLIDDMIEFCHWFMLILFVGWTAFFVYTLWKFHHSRNPRANHDGATGSLSTHLEFSVILVEAVILLGFGIPLWFRHADGFPKPENAILVRAVGEQFLWNFHYAGPDGVFGKTEPEFIHSTNAVGLDPHDAHAKDDVVVKNEMHLPINQDVIVEITTKDVIHNFCIPAMRTAQDAIPGMRIPIWFRPAKESPKDDLGMSAGYEIVCGQLCGSGHGVMRALLFVDLPADFDAWLKASAPAPAAASAAPEPTPAG